MADYKKSGDPLTRGFGMAIALGALAVGAVAAFLNNERSRQMREDLQRQISDLSDRMDHELTARRPEIEDAIQRGRQVAVESLDKVKGAVELGADKAQEYVQRAAVKTSDAAVDLRDKASKATGAASNSTEDTVNSVTTRADDSLTGAASEGTTSMADTGSGQGSGGQDTDLSDPAREAVAESGSAFGDTIDMAGATIGSATVEAAQSETEAELDHELGTGPGESLADVSPGMADYGADTSLGADMTVEREGQSGDSGNQ